MLPLGTSMPSFALPDAVSGRNVSSAELAGQPVVVAFICNHCPYVQHLRSELARFGRNCQERGVAVVGISSNDAATYPQDAPGPMAEEARQHGYVFPYLFDDSQEVAKAFRAACTPDFFLFDSAGKLAYRGQFDDSRPGNGKPVTGADLRRAVDAVLKGEQPSPAAGPQHRLQHQVEEGQRAGLLTSDFGAVGWDGWEGSRVHRCAQASVNLVQERGLRPGGR